MFFLWCSGFLHIFYPSKLLLVEPFSHRCQQHIGPQTISTRTFHLTLVNYPIPQLSPRKDMRPRKVIIHTCILIQHYRTSSTCSLEPYLIFWRRLKLRSRLLLNVYFRYGETTIIYEQIRTSASRPKRISAFHSYPTSCFEGRFVYVE